MLKFRKTVSMILVLAVLLVLAGCTSVEPEKTGIISTQDKMRTYYQIFPYSFADSNGDGVGDLQGIIDKLDYIESLHYDGIWLTPVHPSQTYHKYDVSDYCDIDSQFGTLEDYDRLIEECHSRGMTVLLDLVYNHSSSKHEWFTKCAGAHIRNRQDSKYIDYYNFKPIERESDIESGWARYADSDWAYECRFWSEMPDLNLQNVLDNPEGALAQDLKEIMRFWLQDHGVDGFRLDAVTTYFSGNVDLNTQFLKWLNDTAKEIKPDCYTVAEASWGNPKENLRYQSSGIDSCFAFQHGYNANGNLSYAVRLGKAAYLYLIDEDNAATIGDGLPATFIANHDTGRAYGITMAGAQPDNLKSIYGLMAMCYGPTFSYYGDEIGMAVVTSNDGKSYKDEDKRQPMPWGDEYQCRPVVASTPAEDSEKYPMGSVKEQLKDENSLLHYVARANAIRRAYPQIARSLAQQVYINQTRDLCVVSKGEGSQKIYIVWNASLTFPLSFELSNLPENVSLEATLSVKDIPSVSDGTLTMPPQSFAVLEITE